MLGRRDSLQALIRNHGYATDSVRRLLKPGALGPSVAPVGTLADILEVSGEHEGVVDEFLREELNYVVVESWGAAEEGVRVLKTSDGRATFLVHPMRRASCSKPPRSGRGAGRNAAARCRQGAEWIWALAGSGSAQAAARLPGGEFRRRATAGVALRACVFPYAGRRVLPCSTVTGGKPASEGRWR